MGLGLLGAACADVLGNLLVTFSMLQQVNGAQALGATLAVGL